ncbi:hypothetical protein [Corynebacterium comes]|uniref:DAGKc domain-containing protein n=1 Tax=Corynebacterium comes TaxID=2675218 RepID=A0A6B8W2G3_9CORY|nr:hypothetical protein [Corynebacterium comes]QGU05615.1 hypothetical protein CETAM_11915 [Corynebacterium comes]
MRVLILRCGDTPVPADLPGTVLNVPAIPGRRDLKLLDAAAADLLPTDPTPSLDEISAQPDVPHLGTPGRAPQAGHLPEPLRVIVAGSDAALSAVLTRMMRGDYLWAEVGLVPVGESSVARNWGLEQVDAWQVALNGAANPVPLIRSDLGIALAGSATIRSWDDGEFTGEIIVDDQVLVRHEARDGIHFNGVFGARLVPMVDAPGIAAVRATAPEKLSLTWREKIAHRLTGSSLLDPDSLATGRAVQAGGPSLAVTIDGVRHKRPLERVTFYRHLRDLQAIRP